MFENKLKLKRINIADATKIIAHVSLQDHLMPLQQYEHNGLVRPVDFSIFAREWTRVHAGHVFKKSSCLYGQHADLHAAVVACIAHESEWTLQDHTFMAQTFVMLETSGI